MHARYTLHLFNNQCSREATGMSLKCHKCSDMSPIYRDISFSNEKQIIDRKSVM